MPRECTLDSRVLLIEKNSPQVTPQIITIRRAADFVHLDEWEIMWSLTEYGRCDTDEHIVVPIEE